MSGMQAGDGEVCADCGHARREHGQLTYYCWYHEGERFCQCTGFARYFPTQENPVSTPEQPATEKP